MKVFYITDTITVLRGEKNAEPKYRCVISAAVIKKFGKGPYPTNIQKEVFTFFQQYFIKEFEKACQNETSYTFYREIFILHEQATDLRRSNHYHQLPDGLDQQYISIYRRVLKMILEKGCDVDMIRGEKRDPDFIVRIQPLLNDLLYLGEMVFDFTESFAEFSMVEGISQIIFDEYGLYKQTREPHYDHVFNNISLDMARKNERYVMDLVGSQDFKLAVQEVFGFDYEKIGQLIAALHVRFNLDPPDCLCGDRQNFLLDAANICEVSLDVVTLFFSGLTLSRTNKMPLGELVRKPYLMNRFLYRPFLVWQINGKSYLICGIYSIDEAENSLILNAIPWGKFPAEWADAPGFKAYVYRKHRHHDIWLDDKVEAIVKEWDLKYDRSVKSIQTKRVSLSLLEKSLGEIDFLIISPNTKKLLVTECKHLLGRYDMVNWKQDYDHFTVDGSKPGYNTRLAGKVIWAEQNLTQIEEHFRIKYKDETLSLKNYLVEGVFVINTPTFYMYNAPYRIYTYHQFGDVITGKHKDPVYTLVLETDDSISTYWIKYPYFAKREPVKYEPEEDDNNEVDKYGYPFKKKR